MNNDIQIILQKLEVFIKKYYTNKMIKGLLLVLLFFISFLLIFATLEYFGRFNKTVRAIFYFSYLFGNILIFSLYLVIPALKYFKIGKHLSYIDASKIIAKHFSNVNDKIQNLIELSEITNLNGISKDLLIQSIKQKTLELKPIPFSLAVNFKDNIPYLKFLSIPIILLILIVVVNPSIISQGSIRLINYNNFYEIPPPYNVEILNPSLTIEKGQNITINIKITGKEIPDKLFVSFNGNNFLMKKTEKNEFSYQFINVNNNIDFRFTDSEFNTNLYTINVLPSPTIIDFKIEVIPPQYTKIQTFYIKNIGDVSTPEGSKIIWKFNAKNTNNIFLLFNDSLKLKSINNNFVFSKIARKNQTYSINISNQNFIKNNILNYSLSVIKDMHPEINLKTVEDSSHIGVFYFMGLISDDYGLKKLTFNYKNKDYKKIVSVPITIDVNSQTQEYFYSFDFNTIQEKDVEYYIEVFDNDGFNGSKSTRTSSYTYHKLNDDEIQKEEAEKNKSIGSKIEESKKLTQEIKKDISDLQKDIINNKNSEWENQKKLKNIVDKQKNLEKLINEISKENIDKNKLSENQEKSDELVEKQKQIEELLKQVMDEDMKKLLEELKKLTEQFDEKKLNELSEKLDMSLDDMNKQLDRNLEQLKQFEVEKKLEKTIDDLNKLSEKEEKLSEKTTNKKNTPEQIQEEQQKQIEDFKQIEKQLEELLEKNESLEKPMTIDDFDEERKEINNEMNNSMQEMQENNRKKASQNQKKSSQQMKQMANKMSQAMESSQASQNQENTDDLKQIMENLELFSFNQEDLLVNTKNLKPDSPKKPEISEKQKKTIDYFKIIEDSLYALAKRVPKLDSKINKEILSIKQQNNYLIPEMEDNKLSQVSVRQQNIMTSANELALLLDEVLKQIQNQQKKQGDQQCQNPGNGKPSMSQMKQQQQSLKKQLEGMIKDLKGQPKKPGMGQQHNKQLAKMLAQQEVFQKQLSELMQNSTLSPKDAKKLSEINSMVEDMKRDIANQNITPQTLNRQNLIITRLLEAEQSDFEREIDKKRKSEQGNFDEKRNINEINKYKEAVKGVDELIIRKDLKLNKYFSEKYSQYLLILNDN